MRLRSFTYVATSKQQGTAESLYSGPQPLGIRTVENTLHPDLVRGSFVKHSIDPEDSVQIKEV